MTDALTRKLELVDFVPVVGTEFDVYGEGDSAPALTLTLTSYEASPFGNQYREQPFILFFEGSRALPIEQGLYLLKHASLGDAVLFLIPIGEDEHLRRYQSVFN